MHNFHVAVQRKTGFFYELNHVSTSKQNFVPNKEMSTKKTAF